MNSPSLLKLFGRVMGGSFSRKRPSYVYYFFPLHIHSAIGADHLAGDVSRAVGAQIDDSLRYLPGSADASQRYFFAERRHSLLAVAVVHRRVNHPGSDAVHTHSAEPHFLCQRLSKPDYPRLCRRIVYLAGAARLAPYG